MKHDLLGPRLGTMTPPQLREYVRSLYEEPPSKNPSSVHGVRIHFGARTIVRMERKPKFVTVSELNQLAKDYGKPIDELKELMHKRKVEIR